LQQLQFEEEKDMNNPCCSDDYTHYSCLIEVETDDITGLDRLLETEVGKSFPFGASIEIADNREVYAFNSCFGALMIDFIADVIGYIASKKLNTHALVSFSNQETPFCLFNCGERDQIFLAENPAYLAKNFGSPELRAFSQNT
jgi:hypothetical protein